LTIAAINLTRVVAFRLQLSVSGISNQGSGNGSGPFSRSCPGEFADWFATLLKLSLEFRDDDVDQTRGQWIGHLPFQEPIARNLSFPLSELALRHRVCPLANDARAADLFLKILREFYNGLSGELGATHQ
jgi:hypothetical protein